MWQTLTTLVEGGEATRSVVRRKASSRSKTVRRKASSRSKTVRPSVILGFLRSGRIATYNDVRKYDRCLTKLFNEIHSLTDEQYIVRFSKYGPKNIFLVVLTPDSVNLHKIPDYSIYNYVIPNPCLEPISFLNIEGNTMLVIPCPRPGLNAVSIREFIHSSTRIERCMLWDKVFKTVKPGEYIYTHGFEVPWLHVKIRASVAKYYSKNLLKIFSALEKNNGSTRCFNCGA
jgi:hypothetical protein